MSCKMTLIPSLVYQTKQVKQASRKLKMSLIFKNERGINKVSTCFLSLCRVKANNFFACFHGFPRDSDSAKYWERLLVNQVSA